MLTTFIYMLNQNSNDQEIFNEWNEEKKNIHTSESKKIIFHERQVWWCSLGKNIGDEQDGKNKLFERPVLIIKKFNEQIAWVIPLSSKVKYGKHYYVFALDQKQYSYFKKSLFRNSLVGLAAVLMTKPLRTPTVGTW